MITPTEIANTCIHAIRLKAEGLLLKFSDCNMQDDFPLGHLLRKSEKQGRSEYLYNSNPEDILTWMIDNQLVHVTRTGPTSVAIQNLIGWHPLFNYLKGAEVLLINKTHH